MADDSAEALDPKSAEDAAIERCIAVLCEEADRLANSPHTIFKDRASGYVRAAEMLIKMPRKY